MTIMKTDATLVAAANTHNADLVALAKPRLNMLVVVSAVAGYVMGGGDTHDFWRLTAVALMHRTRLRPMPDKRLAVREALWFAALLTVAGLAALILGANLLSAGVALLTLASYVVIYTPLKKVSSFSTVVGAIPGALPPVIGWAAAQDALSRGAWILFAIVFLWQLPHFLAIAWIHREDYARAGFPMLPVIEPDGRSTARQSMIYAAALLPVSLAPTLVGMAGSLYFAGALVLSLLFVALAVRFGLSRSVPDARRLFFGSITYLPLLWVLMIANRA
jgi:protoheme IX farnesyltransferase